MKAGQQRGGERKDDHNPTTASRLNAVQVPITVSSYKVLKTTTAIAQVPNAYTTFILQSEALSAYRWALSAHHPRLLRHPHVEVTNTRYRPDLATEDRQ